MEDFKNAIIEFAENSKKTKFYFSDIEKAVKKVFPDAKTREIKKAATACSRPEGLGMERSLSRKSTLFI